MNKVYIVVVNYNNFDDTIECLESILKSTYQNFQIFVVNNSTTALSQKNFSDWVSNEHCKDVITSFENIVYPLAQKPIDCVFISEADFYNSQKIIENKIIMITAENKGFAAANNTVLKQVAANAPESALIWILNNDTVIKNDALQNLVDFNNSNKTSRFVMASKLMYYYKPAIIQAVGGTYNNWIGKHSHIGEGEVDTGQYDNYQFKEKDYIVGASIFLSKRFIDEVGLMNEEYFLYFEELDWIKRGLKKGYHPVLVANSIVYHKEGSSIVGSNKKGNTFVAEYYSITNRVRFIKTWYPFNLPIVLMGVFWALLKRTAKGKFKLVKEIIVSVFKILFLSKT